MSKTFGTTAEPPAAKTARREKTAHIVHNEDGRIGERDSYGIDPHPPKG